MSTGLGERGVERAYQSHRWSMLAALLCFGYGVAFTLNIHPIGDGLWFWYARLFREHHRLYADLHLPLQPLFVLLSAWGQDLFGIGWLASKVLAVVQLLVFCVGLWLIARRVKGSDWQRALLVAAAFMMTITANYFRFDDYHITGYCLEVASLFILLRMGEKDTRAYHTGASLLLGVLCGISVSNRLNDGVALLVGCGIALWYVARDSKWISLCEFCAAAAASFLGIILLTGDSLRAWWINSIVRASTIKGGTGSVLKGPLHLLKWQIQYSLLTRNMVANLGLIVVAVACLVQLSTWTRSVERERRWRYWLAAILLLAALIKSSRRYAFGWPNLTIGVYLTLLLIGMTCWVLMRLVLVHLGRNVDGYQWREVLIVIPFLQAAAGATTSGNAIFELLPAIALSLLVLPLATPWLVTTRVRRSTLVALCSVIVASGLYFKTIHPYEWHHFLDRDMFRNRVWYRHPVYGEMYVETDQLRLVKKICSTLNEDGPPTGMLEITNPYANWFCGVPPWRNYVQTWYDTVSSATIEQLVGELKSDPPEWIVYQRSLETLEMNEIAFNHGKPMAHRDLDQLIADRIKDRQWVIEYHEYFEGADWFVIRTSAAPGPAR